MLRFASAQEAQEFVMFAGVSQADCNQFANELVVVESVQETLEKGLEFFNKGAKRVLLLKENQWTNQKVIVGFVTKRMAKKVAGHLQSRFDGGFKIKSLNALADEFVAKKQQENAENLAILEEVRCSLVAPVTSEIEAAEAIAEAEAAIIEAETVMVEAEEVIKTSTQSIADAKFSIEVEEENFEVLADFSLGAGLICLERQAELAANIVKFQRDLESAEEAAKENRSRKEALQNRVAGLRKDLASLDVVKFSRETADKFIRNELIKPIKTVVRKAQRKQCSNKGMTLEMVETLVKEEQAFSRRAWLKELREARIARNKALREAKKA